MEETTEQLSNRIDNLERTLHGLRAELAKRTGQKSPQRNLFDWAESILRRDGPMRVTDLARTLMSEGRRTKSSLHAFSAGLTTRLKADPRFQKIDRGVWGLSGGSNQTYIPRPSLKSSELREKIATLLEMGPMRAKEIEESVDASLAQIGACLKKHFKKAGNCQWKI